MKENLQKLYNTLAMIETKGENTKIMADCLKKKKKMIREADEAAKKEEE